MNSYQLLYLAVLFIPAQVFLAFNFHLLTSYHTTFRSDVTHLIFVFDVVLLVVGVPAALVYMWFYLGGIA